MLRIQDKRIRIGLTVALLAIIGAAGYYIARNVWAGWHFDRAREALERFDFEEANDHLARCLSVRSTDPLTLLLAAQTARRGGLARDADKLLALARKHGADADAVAQERRLQSVQAGDVADAGDLLRLCEVRPNSPEAAIILEAVIEGSLKSPAPVLAQRAVDLWLKHQNSDVAQAQGLYWRGRVFVLASDPGSAQADFASAVHKAPDHFKARLWLATVLIQQQPDQATPHLDWLRQRRPDDLLVRFQIARWHRSLGRPADAGKILDELLATGEDSPGRVAILLERGLVGLDQRQPEDAKDWLLRAAAVSPWDRDVNVALADCFRQLGRLDDAQRYQNAVKMIDEEIAKRKKGK